MKKEANRNVISVAKSKRFKQDQKYAINALRNKKRKNNSRQNQLKADALNAITIKCLKGKQQCVNIAQNNKKDTLILYKQKIGKKNNKDIDHRISQKLCAMMQIFKSPIMKSTN